MLNGPQQAARDRVHELAADPVYRPYVIGYLLSALDERHWEALVASAIDFVESVKAEDSALGRHYRELCKERG
jgi:hypothetical protein